MKYYYGKLVHHGRTSPIRQSWNAEAYRFLNPDQPVIGLVHVRGKTEWTNGATNRGINSFFISVVFV